VSALAPTSDDRIIWDTWFAQYQLPVLTCANEAGTLAYSVGYELKRAYEACTPAGAWGWLWTREMSPFRQDAQFQEFVTRLGMMPYWEKYGPPDDCDLKDGKLSCR
jgi:hypothetical protein